MKIVTIKSWLLKKQGGVAGSSPAKAQHYQRVIDSFR